MIDWIIFLPACFALNLAFGPNNLLSMTYGARNGIAFAQQAALGRLLAFVPMIGLSALGLGLMLTASAVIFNVIKVVGAIYLVWIGVSLWRSARTLDASELTGQSTTIGRAFRTEALVALSNPKAILVFAAFFPQFVAVDAYWRSYAMLGAAFLFMEAIAILTYASIGRFASTVAGGRLRLFQRISGASMCFFGVLLLLSPSPARA
jgi:threonine/homoserine/homoserine lactone efflux protein